MNYLPMLLLKKGVTCPAPLEQRTP